MNRVFFNENAAVAQASFPFAWDFNQVGAGSIKSFLIDFAERSVALVMLVLLAPLFGLLAVAVKLTSKGPAFYSQTRVGKNGGNFSIIKFRTMIQNAEAATGPVISWKADPRVTVLGNFLRKSHLDELPQLLNVLRGEMAFLGPRPERPEFVNQFEMEVPHYGLRKRVKPGITGLAQVCCEYDATAEEKLKFDLLFIRNSDSLRVHSFIIFKTAKKLSLISAP